ncbi:MAG: hypothetical protein WCQ99_09200 [Pseudomonadota bacterium]
MKKTQRVVTIAIATFFLTTLIGCISARVFQTSGTTDTVAPVSDVKVIVALDPASEAWYRTNSTSGALRAALIDELRHAGKFAPSETILEFTVTDFYLRSFAQIFWLGYMAGSDSLVGNVTVKKGSTIVKTFDASAKGSDSAWSAMVLFRLSAGGRDDSLCRLIAKKTARDL